MVRSSSESATALDVESPPAPALGGDGSDTGAEGGSTQWYTARPGDTRRSIAELFEIDVDDVVFDETADDAEDRGPPRTEPATGDPTPGSRPEAGEDQKEEKDLALLAGGERVGLSGADPLAVEAAKFVDDEFRRTGAAPIDIDQRRLVRDAVALCQREPVVDAYRAREDARGDVTAPLNRWDWVFIPLVLVFFAALCAAALEAIFWVIRRLTDFEPRVSAWIPLDSTTVRVALVLGVVLLVVSGWQSNRLDQRYLAKSQYAQRQQGLESKLRLFVYKPAVRNSTRVDFHAATDDTVREVGTSLPAIASTQQLISTETYDLVYLQMTRDDGATIGVRGSRGAGKTDLLRSLCGERRRTSRTSSADTGPEPNVPVGAPTVAPDAGDTVGVFIPAPTSPDEFAFVRRVALQLCARTLERAGVATTKAQLTPLRVAVAIVGILLAVAGALVLLHPAIEVQLIHVGWGLVAVGGLVSLVAISGSRVRRFLTNLWRGLFAPSKSTATQAQRRVAGELATELARRLRYTQSKSVSSEGGASYRGLGAKVAKTVSLTEVPLEKDDVVDELAKLIAALQRAGYRVVVGVDELDKLEIGDTDKIEGLLNTMKSLFSIPACSFLITISTSAWTQFEQRGLRLRTVLDSSLDTIVEAKPFGFIEASHLIRQRHGSLSDSQVLFCNVLAGGIPRDLVRHARRLSEIAARTNGPMHLDEACRLFIEEQADNKVEAAILELRGRPSGVTSERSILLLERLRREWRDTDLSTLLDQLPEDGTNDLAEHERPDGNGDGIDAGPQPDLRVGSSPAEDPAHAIRPVVGYLAFLRLVERAFTGAALRALSEQIRAAAETDGPAVFADVPVDALAPFETLSAAARRLSFGPMTARMYLGEAQLVIEAAERARQTHGARAGDGSGAADEHVDERRPPGRVGSET